MARSSARLSVVADAPVREIDPESVLARIVPELIEAERTAARLHQQLRAESRRLAIMRGVAFIREEHVRQEFGQ